MSRPSRSPTSQQFLAGVSNRFAGVLPGAELEPHSRQLGVRRLPAGRLPRKQPFTLNLGLRYEMLPRPDEDITVDTALVGLFTDTDFTVGTPFIENPSNGTWGRASGSR